MAKQRIAVKEGLFIWPSKKPQLIAAKCSKCGHHTFPFQEMCPECCEDTMEQVYLSRRGKLKCFTGMYNPSPDFKGKLPYTIGIVDFPEGLRVIGLTTENSIDMLNVGMDIELVVETVYEEDDKEVVTYKYKPVRG